MVRKIAESVIDNQDSLPRRDWTSARLCPFRVCTKLRERFQATLTKHGKVDRRTRSGVEVERLDWPNTSLTYRPGMHVNTLSLGSKQEKLKRVVGVLLGGGGCDVWQYDWSARCLTSVPDMHTDTLSCPIHP